MARQPNKFVGDDDEARAILDLNRDAEKDGEEEEEDEDADEDEE